MKLGVIGAGNMAQAIIKGLLKESVIQKEELFITTSTVEHTQNIAKDLQINAKKSNRELVAEVDILLLAVKPYLVETVFQEIQPELEEKDPLIMSVAAGLDLASLQKMQGTSHPKKISRVMPNINATIGKSVTAIASNDLVTPEEETLISRIFESIGSVYSIQEKDFQIFTALAGCSPAFTYLYIDAMSRAGVKNGLPKELATQIATEAVLGSAEMLSQSVDQTPWDLIDKVCSPGGTTVAGVVALEDEKFMSTVIKGLEATMKRDEELKN